MVRSFNSAVLVVVVMVLLTIGCGGVGGDSEGGSAVLPAPIADAPDAAAKIRIIAKGDFWDYSCSAVLRDYNNKVYQLSGHSSYKVQSLVADSQFNHLVLHAQIALKLFAEFRGHNTNFRKSVLCPQNNMLKSP